MLLPKKEFNRITLRTMCCEEDKTNTAMTKDSRHILFPEKQLKRTPSGLSVVATTGKKEKTQTLPIQRVL
jgi:hypothetical protein